MRRVMVTRVGRSAAAGREDVAAAEEPLDVRLQGQSFAIIMRTPGDDRALAAGFLFSERVIEDPTTSVPSNTAAIPIRRKCITS